MLHRFIMNHTSFYVKVLHNEVVTLDTNEVALLKQDATIFYAFKTTSKQEKNRQINILLMYAPSLCCMEVQSLSTGWEF